MGRVEREVSDADIALPSCAIFLGVDHDALPSQCQQRGTETHLLAVGGLWSPSILHQYPEDTFPNWKLQFSRRQRGDRHRYATHLN